MIVALMPQPFVDSFDQSGSQTQATSLALHHYGYSLGFMHEIRLGGPSQDPILNIVSCSNPVGDFPTRPLARPISPTNSVSSHPGTCRPRRQSLDCD